MNVWIVNHYALAPAQAGGTRHHSLARKLLAAGHKTTIIASNVDYVSRVQSPLPDGARFALVAEAGVPFLRVHTPAYGDGGLRRLWSMLTFAARILRPRTTRELERPDIIVGSSPHPFAALAACRLAKRHGVPFVLEIRDLWPQTLVEVGAMSKRHPIVVLLTMLEAYLYREASHIITLLPAAQAHLTSRGARADRITWVPNGIDVDMLPAYQSRTASQPFVVMYAGTHGHANALDVVLDAAERLKQMGWEKRVSFRLIGDGVEKSRLQAVASERALGNISFEPPVPKSEIYKVLARADAFVVAIRSLELYQHGISFNKLFDYLALGRPVIVAAEGGSTPVHEANAGITVSLDGLALAEGVKRLVETPSQSREEMGRRGRMHVLANYDMARLAKRFAGILERQHDANARPTVERKAAT